MKKEDILVVGQSKLPMHLFAKSKYINLSGHNETNKDFLMNWIVNGTFVDRQHAETNPDIKQFIPYCIIERKGDYFSYKRTNKGGEKRLHDLMSLGIGGHINLGDSTYPEDAYNIGFERELKEEIGLLPNQYTHKILGFIYDDSNEVGKVHLGIVHLVKIGDINVKITDKALSKGKFDTLDNMKKNLANFETWSQIVLNSGIL